MKGSVKQDQLIAAPFNLDVPALNWVMSTFASLTTDQKLGQIILPLCRDLSPAAIDAALAYHVGGIHRMPAREEQDLRVSGEYAQRRSSIPLLMSCDIEFSEKSSVKAGTPFPNQMAVAATKDPVDAERMGTIAAREGGYLGFNVTWTPVADLCLNFRSNVVNTRAFGEDPDMVAELARAYHKGAGENGFARSIKHWPGDGLDDRDQHFATTHNTLSLDAWRQSFGAVYADAIANGVQVVMSGHITLKAYGQSLGGKARSQVQMPATLNADLNLGLLRGEYGFNGVIVSDATGMVGFEACGHRRDIVPACIENGCDILLFPNDLAEDFGYLRDGLNDGRLSEGRLDDAVLRILALKASLGLHLTGGALPAEDQRPHLLGSAEHADWSRAVSERTITLVKDTQNLLPLDPARHRRILIAQFEERHSPSGPLPQLQVGEMLEAAGFEVAYHKRGQAIDASAHDIGLYLVGEEGVSAKENLGPQWERLHGNFPLSMERLWAYMPTVFVSLGTPYLLYHMPECRTFVNAYAAVTPVQQALVKALTGQIPFTGTSPVDVFCGLEEARS
ncbi:glycoside hydrolase family 3 protein [Devosia sp. LjRoot3]|uniref:glycoside hydrolase family 3 protein n=1 Tax=Devosia sp. LjRoot3 TaxID=3342319 RepID=UPI003ECF1EA8